MKKKNKALTSSEWKNVSLPIYWVNIDDRDLSSFEKSFMPKWLEENTTKWWYQEGTYFCFGSIEDRVLFVIWLKSGAFKEQYGSVE